MYKNLKDTLLLNGITYKDLCSVLDIPLSVFVLKIEFEGFRLSEAVKIRDNFFPSLPFDYLFETEKKGRVSE